MAYAAVVVSLRMVKPFRDVDVPVVVLKVLRYCLKFSRITRCNFPHR